MRIKLDRTRAFAISALAVAFVAAPRYAPAATPVYVDGARTEASAIVRNDTAFVPLRGVFEKLGASVSYLPPRTVVAQKSGRTLVHLQLGKRAATVGGNAQRLPVAPFVSGARIYVPLRLISEAAGAGVAYSPSTHAVRVTAARAAAVVAAPVVAAAPVAAQAAPAAEHRGIPWWVWLLAALTLLGLLLLFARRRKPEPTISTRSSPGDPTIERVISTRRTK